MKKTKLVPGHQTDYYHSEKCRGGEHGITNTDNEPMRLILIDARIQEGC